MTLVDKLHSLLTRHWEHASSQTNQGAVRLIEDHLKRLDGADEAEVHKVLDELYGALNAPAPAEVTPKAAKTAKASAASADKPAA